MTPRDDSQLTRMYETGSCDLEASEVARELVATDFIFQNTLYGELMEDFLRIVAHRVKRQSDLTWNQVWDVVRTYGPPCLKLICIMQSHVRIPNMSVKD